MSFRNLSFKEACPLIARAAGKFRSSLLLLPVLILVAVPSRMSFAQGLHLNDLGYFEEPGLNVLVFSNQYNGYFFDEKTAGIELIHHGVRTATGGAVRLRSTPEQWDQIPLVVERSIHKDKNSIEFLLRYEEFKFDSRVVVTAVDAGVTIDVYIDKPLPGRLVGNAGFNLEFLPSAYFEKTFLMDDKPGIFPLYPAGPMLLKPDSIKIGQYAGHSTFDDPGGVCSSTRNPSPRAPIWYSPPKTRKNESRSAPQTAG